MDPLIKVDRISKSFSQGEVLKNISMDIRQGEILAVIGPSGSGKSTFIRCLNGLEQVDGGSVVIDGIKVDKTASVAGKVGMVFQQFNLFPHYTVLENIVRPCRTVKKMPKQEAENLARSLSMNPDIMLFDEPTSSLDPELAYEVFDTIQSIAEENMTIILVTHQMHMVKQFARRVVFLENGSVGFDGTFQELLDSPDARIRQFLKKIYA